ncbi:MAG: phosphopantothenoylcysteine decarboxylase [Candidatus Omnitrophica bacterium]|nr:phosphopantothenoylcysteine decarboxylase [Candidatus Omnitrophota bacterium]
MKKKQLKHNILITAGPTREFIDPIRFISNPSTGTIGYILAQSAKRRGNDVVLLSGPTHLDAPVGVKTVCFNSALELKKCTDRFFDWADIIICTAAVADFRPAKISNRKIKKDNGLPEIKLVKNPDILKGLARKKKNKVLIGFALETENVVENSLKKLKSKNLDLIVGNLLSEKSVPFGKRQLTAFLIEGGNVKKHSKISKKMLARIILDRADKLCYILMQPKKGGKLW